MTNSLLESIRVIFFSMCAQLNCSGICRKQKSIGSQFNTVLREKQIKITQNKRTILDGLSNLHSQLSATLRRNFPSIAERSRWPEIYGKGSVRIIVCCHITVLIDFVESKIVFIGLY